MSVNPNMKNGNQDPQILKITTKDDEIKELNYKTEKHEYEINLKSLNIDNDYYKKKWKPFKKKKVLLIVSEILIGSGPSKTSSTFSLINPSIGIPIASCSALLISIAILITNEFNEFNHNFKVESSLY